MKFVIKGTDDKARAALGTNLEAQNKAFEASLNSLFKPAPAPTPKPAAKAAPKPAEPMRSTSGKGQLLGTNRDRRFI
jgi:hypothetical protein